ncbi:MAG: hypothetical protein E5W63_02010 [Mesorhizobium sp.]|nr:MAG: hypothetical protein E5W63_02010 [Mesorhizobium sp.]
MRSHGCGNDCADAERNRQAALKQWRGIRTDQVQVDRIEEMIVVVVYAPEYLIDRGKRLEQQEAPDLVQPEIAARTQQSQDKADCCDRGNRQADTPMLARCRTQDTSMQIRQC